MTPLQFFQSNITSLTHDFLGIHLYPKNLEDFFLSLFFSIALIFLLFLFGNKIKRFFPKTGKTPLEESFLSLAFGHIFFATGIALLGVFSLLTPFWILMYIIIVGSIGIFPLKETLKKLFSVVYETLIFFQDIYKANPLILIGILLFLGIGIVKLLSPEIGVDAVFYHHDYPKEYLRIHSLIEYPKGSLVFMTTPQLAQMEYVVSEFFGLIYAQRMVPFLFFLLDIFLLLFIGMQKKNKKFAALPALLLISSPTVIAIMPSGYVDAQWLFLWLLTFWVLTNEKLSSKTLMLGALLYGGVMASKVQALPFMPAFLAYIFFASPKKEKIKSVLMFFLLSFLFPSLWYIRSFILTGNFLFPATTGLQAGLVGNFLTLNSIQQKTTGLLENFNPFILLGISAFVIFYFRRQKVKSFYQPLLFILFLAGNYAVFPILYFAGRFLFFPFSLLTTFAAEPFDFFKNKFVQLSLVCVILLLFSYYAINAILILPYGLGFANTNAYLTRVLSRDNASYYDFDKSFSPFITATDYIGTYTIEGFFYADFFHRDIEYAIKQGDDFSTLKTAGFTKLLIKHGDMQWFCTKWHLKNCTPNKYTFLTSYTPAQQYLYELK